MPYLMQARLIVPFRLALRDHSFPAQYAGHLMAVRIVGGHGRQVTVFRGEEERDPAHTRRWLRTTRELPTGEERVDRVVCLNFEDQLYLEEASDYLGYTLIELTWELPNAPNDIEGREGDLLREEAFTRAQWVVRQYRAATDEVDVRVPGARDSPYVILLGAADYQFDDQGVEAEFIALNRQFRWLPPDVSGVAKEDWEDEKIQAFAERLRHDAAIPVWREMLLEAKELSKIQRNHRLAIVVTASAVEAYARTLIREECVLRGLQELPRRDGTMQPVEDWVETADVRLELLGCGAERLVGGSVKDCQEYQSWYNKVHTPRNQIVHRGRTEAEEADAEAAFVAAVAFIERLWRFVLGSRPT